MRSRVKYALTAFLAVTLFNIFFESAESGHQLSQVICVKRSLVLPVKLQRSKIQFDKDGKH